MTAALKLLIRKFLSRAGIALTGPLGWLASLVIDKLLIQFEKWARKKTKEAQDAIKNYGEKKTDEKNAQEYKEVLNSPAKSESQLDDATSDFLNGKH